MGAAQGVGGPPIAVDENPNGFKRPGHGQEASTTMPLPKRRHSKTRGRKRRTHYKMVAPTRSLCPQCREIKLPHRVCPHCGFYKGREVISVEGA